MKTKENYETNKRKKTSCVVIFVGSASGKAVKHSFQDDNTGSRPEHCVLFPIPYQLIYSKIY